MKFLIIAAILSCSAHAQTTIKSDSASLAVLAKEMMKGGKSWSLTAESYANSLILEFKKYMPQVPDSVWAGFDIPTLVDAYYDYQVPILLKYFTVEDFVAIIAWNNSTTGRKFNSVITNVYGDMAEAGKQYSKDMAQKIMAVLSQKGYNYNGESK